MDIFSVIGIVIVLLMFGTIFAVKTADDGDADEPQRNLARTG